MTSKEKLESLLEELNNRASDDIIFEGKPDMKGEFILKTEEGEDAWFNDGTKKYLMSTIIYREEGQEDHLLYKEKDLTEDSELHFEHVYSNFLNYTLFTKDSVMATGGSSFIYVISVQSLIMKGLEESIEDINERFPM